MLKGVPKNIFRDLPNQWSISTQWSIHILPTQNRGVKTPLFNYLWCLLLLDVKGGFYEQSHSFTKPMAY